MKQILLCLVMVVFVSCTEKDKLNFSVRPIALPSLQREEAPKSDAFLALEAQILKPKNCLQCHAAQAVEAQLLTWVQRGDAENSKLFKRVKDGTMPKRGVPLTAAELETVRAYIEDVNFKFETIQARILGPSCVECHKNKTSEASLANWINPEKPLTSKLLTTVLSNRMPKDRAKLSSEEKNILREYVLSFAR
jgi:hypothetical protein